MDEEKMGDKSVNPSKVMDSYKSDEHHNVEFVSCGLIDNSSIKVEPDDVNIDVLGQLKTEIDSSGTEEDERNIFVKEEIRLDPLKHEIFGSPVSSRHMESKGDFELQCNGYTTINHNTDAKPPSGTVKKQELLEGNKHISNAMQEFCSDNFKKALPHTMPIFTAMCDRPSTSQNLLSYSNCSDYSSSNSQSVDGRIQTLEEPFQCDVCSKSFHCRSKLDRHSRTHSGDRPFRCDVCNKCYTEKSTLNIHIRSHSGEKPFQCNICNRSFSSKSILGSHFRTHTGEKNFHCDICNKSFPKKSILDIHIRTHTGEKPFHCDICKKSFSSQSSLHKHILTHTGVKPFNCNVCNKSFTLRSNLDRHYRTHTGDKSFHCTICNKSFSQKIVLDVHIRTHSGEKPFHCNVCNKSFICRSHLNRHSRIHTSDKPFH